MNVLEQRILFAHFNNTKNKRLVNHIDAKAFVIVPLKFSSLHGFHVVYFPFCGPEMRFNPTDNISEINLLADDTWTLPDALISL